MWNWVMALELEHNTGVNLISETFTSVIYKRSYCFLALKQWLYLYITTNEIKRSTNEIIRNECGG